MEIIVDIHLGEDGRAEGTVRPAGHSQARRFSGNLEFLALVESLYQVDDQSPIPQNTPMEGTDND
jgi:hypothetical protein